VFDAVLAVLLWFLYLRMRAGDPRRLRIAVTLVCAVWFTALAVFEILFYLGLNVYILLMVAALLAPFSILALAFVLLRNGLQMIRKEGRSLGNSLAGLLGLVVLAMPVLGLVVVFAFGNAGIGLALLMLYGCAQVGLTFLVFLVFTGWYARRPARTDPDAVVVLGSGLIGGRVPPLLASRLDLGLAWFRRLRGAGWTGPLIPSGGRGPDEPRAESEAMAEYLLERLAEDGGGGEAGQEGMGSVAGGADVIAEDRSRTTEENLRFSRRIADAEVARRDVPATGHLLVATNGYHVPRAALLSRRIGVDADVLGSKTARYYVPSAFIREFAAVVLMHKWLHVLLALPGLAAGIWFILVFI
jgi:uncharacterized SAM-binding protein YcdF (DUF218 family)